MAWFYGQYHPYYAHEVMAAVAPGVPGVPPMLAYSFASDTVHFAMQPVLL